MLTPSQQSGAGPHHHHPTPKLPTTVVNTQHRAAATKDQERTKARTPSFTRNHTTAAGKSHCGKGLRERRKPARPAREEKLPRKSQPDQAKNTPSSPSPSTGPPPRTATHAEHQATANQEPKNGTRVRRHPKTDQRNGTGKKESDSRKPRQRGKGKCPP